MTTEDEADGLRERKKRATRLALSEATVRLIIERGWANVTIEDIAEAANVSVRTFRNYFANKADAVASRHVERMTLVAEQLRARPAAEPLWDALIGAVQAQFVGGDQTSADSPQARRWRDGLRLMLAEPALHGAVLTASVAAQDELARAVAERTGTDVARDVYPALVAGVITSAVSVALAHSMRPDAPRALGPLLREVLDQLAAGLPAPTRPRGRTAHDR